MWCGREITNNKVFSEVYTKVRAFSFPLFRKRKTERAPHLDAECFTSWLAEVERTEARQDGSEYRAGPVLRAIAAGQMPKGAGHGN